MAMKTTARIQLLPAKAAPYVVIIRRKPSKTYHIIRWNVETDRFEHGSWFTGHIYVHSSDVSFDGKWMVYLARGVRGTTWNGVCLLPYLKTYLETETPDSWGGGGYWKDKRTLVTNEWAATKGTVPFKIENHANPRGVFKQRMLRDGWIQNEAENCWTRQFHRRGPTLEARYKKDAADLEFRLLEYPELLNQSVESATFASNGALIFAQDGWVYRYTSNDLRRGKPAFAADLNGLTREQTRV
jgi:hypothetical protein